MKTFYKVLFSLFILVAGTCEVWGATITSDGTARLYFNIKAVSWWNAGTNGNGNFGYFYNNSTGKNAWSAHAIQYSGDTYYVVIPSGSWAGVILTRNNTSTAPSWDNKWNQTGDITLSSTSNYISKFSEGSNTVTWGTAIKPTSTASVSSCAQKMSVQDVVTLSSQLTSNSNINTISKTEYKVSPSIGTVNNDKFTATSQGECTITATLTYYPNGYSSLTSTVTATTTITIANANTVYLKPTNYWPDANARFAVYAWDNCGGDKWFEMEDVSCAREYFKVDIPAKYTQFKFVRLKPTTNNDYNDNNEGLNWENKWNETSDLTIPTGNKDLYTFPDNHIYLKPNSNWKIDNARFAAYFFVNEDDSKTKWMSMFEGEDGVYYCDIPTEESYDRVIFCRMNPATSDNTWDNKWNQTSDLTWDGANNLYTVKDGTWNEGGGTWSIYWSTYKAPSYKVKLVADSHGTYKVKYGEETATSKIEGDVEIEVPLNTIITISTNEAKLGYKQENAAIKIGNQDHIAAQLDTEYTICGPTTITGNFVAATDIKVYLEPTENWKKDNARFKAFVFDDTHSEWLADLMTLVNCDENNPIYSCILPAGYHSVIFCRVKDNSVNDFNYEEGSAFWNQTNDLLIPVGSDKNRYTITSTGNKNNKENANGNWHTPPTYEIILNPGEHGTITVSPSTSVALGETIAATLTPNTGYSKDEAKITIGNNEEETLIEGQEYSICGPTTITATWTPNPHTVTWIVDGVMSVVDYNYGDAITAPEDPTKTGYTFAGWGKEIPATMPDEDLEFTAQWTPNIDTKYQVKHYQQNIGSDEYTLVETEDLKGTTDSQVTPSVKNYEGFTSPTATEVTIKADGSLVVEYQYTRNSYNVTWVVDGATTTETYLYGAAINKPADPTKEGHTFAAWTPAVADNMPAENVTYTATWTVNQYTVTWDVDGSTTTETYNYGAAINKPADPTKTGYTFAGWSPAVADNMPANNVTYTAQWTINTYTVQWSVNGAEYTEGNPTTTVEYGSKVATLPTPPDPNAYCGEVFVGWVAAEIETSTNVAPAFFVTADASPEITDNVTFYAVFADYEN